ncbi:23S rRNA (adenine(1618)-N(6))-methyltransferase RlmF [Candidatus Methylopumilus turicensis]|uniref:Ribosomal RNA large subunit methyltransferase F n=1 Tax=Candidatus Methylopumilus turicensis TaxID=1581680 RepID=A0A0B7ITK4_9PROT|nr:23S rRNA (adenine(1618)-N(6))-methyltransferase RlmF [Candidatus Methylopumilus turicensis]CEN55615.1 Ribosomal RNA large subunit methyltransferase F [Candidatus Methylopumilus turicensis]
MHPRNKHQGRYDLQSLSLANPSLKSFVKLNAFNDLSIDFANPIAVKALNKALLMLDYNITDWDIPDQFLCPPIPGRADYIHFLADLIGHNQTSVVKGLDVGVGANVIYPLIGHREYEWDFVGVDINLIAIQNAQRVLDKNNLSSAIELRLQKNPKQIFNGIIREQDFFEFSMCNPPFHASLKDAQAGTKRKMNGLAKTSGNRPSKTENPTLNFGGQAEELYCEGGEISFINQMIEESQRYQHQCRWFTTLVSKSSNLPKIQHLLKASSVKKTNVVEMSQGQKQSRFVAWSYM